MTETAKVGWLRGKMGTAYLPPMKCTIQPITIIEEDDEASSEDDE